MRGVLTPNPYYEDLDAWAAVRARVRGERFRNPYDRGYANNFRQVFGAAHPLIAVLPSSRKPPGAPWPAPRARATVDVV